MVAFINNTQTCQMSHGKNEMMRDKAWQIKNLTNF